jgi:hypothetical protein
MPPPPDFKLTELVKSAEVNPEMPAACIGVPVRVQEPRDDWESPWEERREKTRTG